MAENVSMKVVFLAYTANDGISSMNPVRKQTACERVGIKPCF